MRDIKVLKVYNLVDSKGNKLQLRLGILKSRTGEVCIPNADMGYRWSFIGEHIPMPVRSMTWFNGFPENIMLDWLKGNGWALRSRVDMSTGKTTVYELPSYDESSKGNENPGNICEEFNRKAFEDAINRYVDDHNIVMAVRLYRYAHGGTIANARDKVREITSH